MFGLKFTVPFPTHATAVQMGEKADGPMERYVLDEPVLLEAGVLYGAVIFQGKPIVAPVVDGVLVLPDGEYLPIEAVTVQ